MGLLSWLSRKSGGVRVSFPGRRRESVVTEYNAWLRDDDDGRAVRGMTGPERMRALRLSRKNYKASGIYGAMVDMTVAHVVGDGVAFEFEDEAVGEYVNGQFADPANAFHLSLEQRFRGLVVEGEHLLTVTALLRNGTTPTGDIRLGRLDPEGVCGRRVDPLNHDHVLALRYENEGSEPVWLPIARATEEDGAESPGLIVEPKPKRPGDEDRPDVSEAPVRSAVWLSYWTVNSLGGRGAPLYSRSIDKSTILDGLVDHCVSKAEYANRFFGHAKYQPQDSGGPLDTALEEKLHERFAAMANGTIFVSSNNVDVDYKAPELGMLDHRALYEMTTGYILGSHTIPKHWFASDDPTRAAAAEAGSPIYRFLKSVQARWANDLAELVRFVIWIGKESGRIADGADEAFRVVPADFATRDTIRDVQEMTWLVGVFDNAVSSGYLHPTEAQAGFRKVFGAKPYGDVLEETPPDVEAIREEKEALAREMLPLHRDGTGAQEPDPEATGPKGAGEKPGKQASPPGK